MKPSIGKLRYLAIAAVFAIVALIILIPFLRREKESVTYKKNLMGTLVEITLFEGREEDFDRATGAAFDEIRRLEALLSSYNEDSDVSRASRASGVSPVKVADETLFVTRKAIEVAELSDGAFDPTVGSLSPAWGFSGESKRVPSRDDMQRLLPLVDYRGIMIDADKKLLRLEKKGSALNLGGIAKGFIVNRAAEKLKEHGVTGAIIKAGGDMLVMRDESEDMQAFKVGIKNPRHLEKLMGEIKLKNGAIATSGDYERFFVHDGVRYHHILDPRTGLPARASMATTIVAKDPVIADGLSTAVFVLGPEKGMRLIESLEGVEGLIVGADGSVHTSENFPGEAEKKVLP